MRKATCRLHRKSSSKKKKELVMDGRGHPIVSGCWSDTPRNRFFGNIQFICQFAFLSKISLDILLC